MDTRWHCIHARPKKESRIAAYLQETLGLETYFPRLQRPRLIRRVKRLVTEPLFPRYLFCRFDYPQNHRAVQYAPEVIGVVKFGGAPAVVENSLIEGLKNWAGEAGDVIALQPSLRPGDPVEITDGPLRGLQAVILSESSGRERVAVVLSILEHDVRMTISRWQLARVD